MNEPFILSVYYDGKSYELPAAFQRYGFTYRIIVLIQEHNYIFEPDEEGLYRVLGGDLCAGPQVDSEFLKVIARQLSKL